MRHDNFFFFLYICYMLYVYNHVCFSSYSFMLFCFIINILLFFVLRFWQSQIHVNTFNTLTLWQCPFACFNCVRKWKTSAKYQRTFFWEFEFFPFVSTTAHRSSKGAHTGVILRLNSDALRHSSNFNCNVNQWGTF